MSRNCIFIGLLCAWAHFACAQSAVRPKIGLTLSGGGAKGLAHIGILQAIDSAGLHIDCITGTSMGSIIGAMYAAGYSGDTIEKMTRPLDWGLLFSTAPHLNTISIEEKSEYEKYAVEIPFEDGKFKIGKGIIEGQELWLKFSEVFRPVYNVTDFSKFSIPFACVGTDLATGNAVVMDHGNIVTAIRASMAIPSVFTPVKYEDKLLVDGGVVNNFPVLEAKSMGADYVIGVNLSQGLLKAEELHSALDILLQIGFFKDAADFEKHRAECDLFILPGIGDYSAGSFDASDTLIAIGKETGRQFYPYFKRLADSLDAIYGKRAFVSDRLPKDAQIRITRYSVDGLKQTRENFFLGMLGLKAGKSYSHEEMSTAIRRVYGSRYYRVIRYDFLPDGSGGTEMRFHVEENPQTDVKVALNYNDFTKMSLKFNMTGRDFLLKESRALASVSLSENPRLYGEYFKYINPKRTARAVLSYYLEAIDFPIYDDFRLFETLRSVYHAVDLQLQVTLNRSSSVGIGQKYIYSKIRTEETPSLIYNGHNNYGYAYLSYTTNSLNQKYFPTKGWLLKADGGYIYGQTPEFEYTYNDSTVNSDSIAYSVDNYFRIFFDARHYSEISKKFSWSQGLTVGWLSEKNPYVADYFLAGGVSDIIRNQVPFVGLNEAEVKTGSIASLQFGLQFKMSKNAYLSGRFNVAAYDFKGTALGNLSATENFLTGYGLSFGYDSAIGPIEFTVMHCDQDSKVRTSFNIGFGF